MIIALESPNQPDVRQLIEDLDAYQVPLYPAESHHGVDISVLEQPKVLFAVARSDDGAAVACGAIVLEAEYGELKRMYTRPEQRGQGIARRLLDFLETQAQQRGCRAFALETGYLQTDAIKLYQRCGYALCGPFGDYLEDPNSVFMQKRDCGLARTTG
ncbi:GNAT family N-acetyltransferase [Pseudoduganella danionis]|uniref:GNAT family N-acetyltransferase n=1 Tax=Pseudoduganella danionis TaxID=1890295 RepID=A0ABW9SLY4_9BURK|nr:GNAT family N-acetyltransferase [Pseudoduganella danionis]MTW33182.1 GNAT family N-acetyltransferase [Pseudoduganella danionis]